MDAVVNAANSALAGGGGVDGAIHRAAGAAQLRAACARLGAAQPATPRPRPGSPCRRVGSSTPWGRSGAAAPGEPELLASCYRRCLAVADELGARTVAFPAISTGVYGYPPEEAAAGRGETLRGAVTRVELARLVAFDAATLRLYESELAAGRQA